MKLLRALILTLILCCPVIAADFTARDGIWLHQAKPYYSTTAHAIFHHFRENREAGIKELQGLKRAGFNIVETYWQWGKDLDPATSTYSFAVFDDFAAECDKLGLKMFCMFQEYVPIWLADKLGWGHTSEEGTRDVRVDDFYVCDPSYVSECRRFYLALAEHLRQHPEISKNVLYYNMGGEYKPFRPNRQPKPLDYGYDDLTVTAFRKWLAARQWTPSKLAARWGAPAGAYASWDDVWPAVNMKEADYKGHPLERIGAARWDWFEFRQEVASQHVADTVKWLREAGDTRPLIHEYNTVTPGGLPLFLDWSRVGARDGQDGIYIGTGTFDREFDFSSLVHNLAIARGASDAPWQSNEQKGNTAPEWMMRHAWALIAMGGTGVHFWDWNGQGWGVVNPDGTPSEGYPSAVRLNAQFEFLGDLLKASRPMPNRIAILALAEETLFAPYGHDRERDAIMKALIENGWGPEVAIITDDQILRAGLTGYRLIFSTGQVRMRQAVREKLAEFVRDGGTLWLTPGSAAKNELDEPNAVNPGAPLDRVAGVRVTGDIKPVISPVRFAEDSKDRPFGLLDKTARGTARPVAHMGDRPVIWRNRYGRGICYFQLAATAYPPSADTPLSRDSSGMSYYIRSNAGQPPLGLLRRALTEQGIEAYARVVGDGGRPAPVLAGVRRADPGYMVFLIEADNRRSSVRVQLNRRRLELSDQWIAYCPGQPGSYAVDESGSFRTALVPAESKVLHLVPKAEYRKWRDRYTEAKWQAITAKLPPIPEKKLMPPSEIGKVNPGDLANVRPKPHGERWLLVDLSRHANRSLIDEGKQENAKAFLGTVGTGDNDLAELPAGLQTFLGVPFDILDPKTSPNSCLITKTNGRPWLGPLEFTGIPVRSRVSRMHWLYGSGWAPFDLPVGYITYHYSDGTRNQENLICGKNIMNWWGRAQEYESPKLQLAWGGNTPAAKRNYTTVGLYHYAWENPHPEKTVQSVDISSYGGDACIIVVAVTAETLSP